MEQTQRVTGMEVRAGGYWREVLRYRNAREVSWVFMPREGSLRPMSFIREGYTMPSTSRSGIHHARNIPYKGHFFNEEVEIYEP